MDSGFTVDLKALTGLAEATLAAGGMLDATRSDQEIALRIPVEAFGTSAAAQAVGSAHQDLVTAADDAAGAYAALLADTGDRLAQAVVDYGGRGSHGAGDLLALSAAIGSASWDAADLGTVG